MLRVFGQNCEKIILQNYNSISYAKRIWEKDKIVQFPFIPPLRVIQKVKKQYDFIFVGGFDYHKNLKNVLKSWEKCKELGMEGSLAITNSEKEFYENFTMSKTKNLEITFLGNLPYNECVSAISRSNCLIFSSTVESLALPLIEAEFYNVNIIASEHDFVYEVCNPLTTFVETNVNSITRAILKFKKININSASLKLRSVEEFKNLILK